MSHDRRGSLVYGGESFRANLCNAANGSRDRPIKILNHCTIKIRVRHELFIFLFGKNKQKEDCV